MLLHPGERIAAIITAVLLAADLVLIFVAAHDVDWSGYAGVVSIGLGAFACGLFYRRSGRSEEISLAATATGLFILFTIAGSLFNYLLLPIGERRIDAILMTIDGYLGYSWPGFVTAVSSFPAFGAVLRMVYLSSLAQLVVVIVVLGFAGRRDDLHRFLVTGMLAALMAIAIWSLMPSFGPSAYHVLPAETEASLRMVVGSLYGAELNRLGAEGPIMLSPRDGLGLIAFPSFHTVMACMAVWFTASMRRLFPVFLAVNLLMMPAILVHGGHHLVDIFGGIAVFAAALFIACRTLAASAGAETASPLPQA
ncbi:phosphatase PAP2 family protein [Aquamicrobium sp. LC103]|uniref:phosphatase PAP2 family protein n=1 Tax=Aquamicrobium sp. LC103 TaxID=1120658 RepID=UPI00063E6EB6|nr:phosphatase PAP2 family protein [Aquamicrobium sp. LC103]TKT76953.1 hypothetical protein XW59_015980 [Aquamicrobium sp. LC103]